MYTVIFNLNSRNPILMTDSHGFIARFGKEEDATEEAKKWLDNEDYFEFKIYSDNF